MYFLKLNVQKLSFFHWAAVLVPVVIMITVSNMIFIKYKIIPSLLRIKNEEWQFKCYQAQMVFMAVRFITEAFLIYLVIIISFAFTQVWQSVIHK